MFALPIEEKPREKQKFERVAKNFLKKIRIGFETKN
jgi:hypothetical protein